MGRFGRILLALVLILVGGFFLFAAIKAIVTKPGTEAQLKNAPFITDGKVNPANEGKTVIVLVDFNKIGGAVDDLFGFTFQSPLVRRQVEVYKYESSYRFAWRRVEDGETAVDSAIFLGTPDALEYEIDPALLKSVSAGKNITEADFNQDQLKDSSPIMMACILKCTRVFIILRIPMPLSSATTTEKRIIQRITSTIRSMRKSKVGCGYTIPAMIPAMQIP